MHRDESQIYRVCKLILTRVVQFALASLIIVARVLDAFSPLNISMMAEARKIIAQALSNWWSRSARPKRRPAALQNLWRALDWIPFPKSREAAKALVADERHEITAFHRQKRHSVARWRALWAWLRVLHIVFMGPIQRKWMAFRDWVKGVLGFY
jgi:hypothetical protein